jgi:hypothetical protein
VRTVAIQRALSKPGPKRVILDGAVTSIAGLNIPSDTVLIAYGCTVTLKANSNRAILRNATRTRNAIADAGITVLGGTWDGNRDNQTGTDIYSPGVLVQEEDGTFITGFQFYGVSGLTLRDVKVQNCKSFAIHTANTEVVRGYNVWIDNDGGQTTQDGWKNNGPGQDIRVYGLRVSSYDDGYSVCPDDGNEDISVSNKFGPYVGIGTIEDVYAEITAENSLYIARVMARVSRANRIKLVLTGSCRNRIATISGFTGSNNGNYGTIDIDADVMCNAAVGSDDIAGVLVANNVESLRVRMTRNDWVGNRAAVYVKSGSTVDQLDTDISIRDTNDANPGGIVSVLGTVKSFTGRGNWHATGSPTGSYLYAVGGTVTRANLSGLTLPSGVTAVAAGSTVTTLQGGNPAVLPSKSVVLSTASVSPGSAYADVGNLSLTVTHGAGDYVVTADVRCIALGSDALVVRLAVNGTGVASSERQCVAPAAFEGHTAGLRWTLTGLAASDVITLQAIYQGVADVTINSDANGRTVLAYSKLGY